MPPHMAAPSPPTVWGGAAEKAESTQVPRCVVKEFDLGARSMLDGKHIVSTNGRGHPEARIFACEDDFRNG